MRQGHREKLSVTIDPRLYEMIERHAERAKATKSKVVEEAIRVREGSRLAVLAREGYQRMAAEDLMDAEAYLPVSRHATRSWPARGRSFVPRAPSVAAGPSRRGGVP